MAIDEINITLWTKISLHVQIKSISFCCKSFTFKTFEKAFFRVDLNNYKIQLIIPKCDRASILQAKYLQSIFPKTIITHTHK